MAIEDPNTSPLPPYPEMILAAISALDEKEGSSKSSISKYIESQYGELPAVHETLLTHHLNKMKESGQLLMVKENYIRSNAETPVRRGRGRPPKPKLPVPPGTVLSPPRPRGRPPKPKDPNASLTGSVTAKPRGRPPAKKARLSGPPRPRGRPPKAKPPFPEVGFD